MKEMGIRNTIRNIVMMLAMTACGMTLASGANATRKISIDDGWEFAWNYDGGVKEEEMAKAKWTRVTLPHDWSIGMETKKSEASGNDGGYYPTGKGIYRKELTLLAREAEKELTLYFEGVYMNSEVYVNGELAGRHAYGFSGYFCKIKNAREGKNTIVVKVDNSKQKNCRWYTGSGIYRHVWLIETGKTHIEPWGIGIKTEDVTKESATVETEVEVETEKAMEMDVTIAIREKKTGKSVATETRREQMEKGVGKVRVRTKMENPELWSVEEPSLYEMTVTIKDAKSGELMDEEEETFGVRKIEYDAERGLRVNGERVKLNGGCLHHDNGAIGAMAMDKAETRKAKMMKEAGFNAARTSHNHPSEAFLRACDEIGLMVIDEAFDGWREAKNDHDYSTLIDSCWTEDIDALAKRDRNHASVFCWSIGNEVIERKKIEVIATAKKMADRIRETDVTRPITSALASWDEDWEIYDPLAKEHDIVGYNYLIDHSEADHKRVPERVMMQTESYPKDAFESWRKMEYEPYIVGDFVWTAIDYLGESGIGRTYYEGETEGEHWQAEHYPWHGAYCGDIDLTGKRKPISYYRELLHDKNAKTYMAVREPSGWRGEIKTTMWSTWPTEAQWNWEGWEGKTVTVEVYSHCEKIELTLNGKKMGEKACGEETRFMATFDIAYEPGELVATGYRDGKESEKATLRTAGKATRIELTPDTKSVVADGQDLCYIVAELKDKDGNVCMTADEDIEFAVRGGGEIMATCSGALNDTVAYTSHRRKTMKGRSMVIVRTTDKAKEITVEAKSKTGSAKTKIKVEPYYEVTTRTFCWKERKGKE